MKRKPLRFSTILKWSAITVVAVAVLFILFMMLTMKGMAPLDTGKAAEGIWAVRDSNVNLYLVEGATGYIAIDAGADPDRIAGQMRSLDIDPSRVHTVLLTHSDNDHIGGVALFSHAAIYMSSSEEQIINGNVSRSPFMQNRAGFSYNTIVDEQQFTIDGVTVRCLLIPGHTIGSMAFLINGRLLFTGDSMRLEEGKAGPFIRLFNMDTPLQKESLKKLAGLQEVETVFTGHFGMTDDFSGAFAGYKNRP